MVSAQSAVQGHGEIAFGNAIGSVICNTALISALTAAIAPCLTPKKNLKAPVLFFFSAAAVYMLFVYLTKGLSRIAGAVLLLLFIAYIFYMIFNMKKHPELQEKDNEEPSEDMPLWKAIVFLVVGAAFIALGANFLVNNGTKIAEALGVPESVIALTFVALGTSLPELTTAIISLVKGHGSLSLGNIIGANFFDLVLVSGLSPLLSPFQIPMEKTIGGMNASLAIDLPLMTVVMAILTIPALIKGKVSRWQGIVLLILYVGYCVFQFAF